MFSIAERCKLRLSRSAFNLKPAALRGACSPFAGSLRAYLGAGRGVDAGDSRCVLVAWSSKMASRSGARPMNMKPGLRSVLELSPQEPTDRASTFEPLAPRVWSSRPARGREKIPGRESQPFPPCVPPALALSSGDHRSQPGLSRFAMSWAVGFAGRARRRGGRAWPDTVSLPGPGFRSSPRQGHLALFIQPSGGVARGRPATDGRSRNWIETRF